jgi:hypothetical protein
VGRSGEIRVVSREPRSEFFGANSVTGGACARRYRCGVRTACGVWSENGVWGVKWRRFLFWALSLRWPRVVSARAASLLPARRDDCASCVLNGAMRREAMAFCVAGVGPRGNDASCVSGDGVFRISTLGSRAIVACDNQGYESAIRTPSCRPRSPARCEKNRSLLQRVHD